ncbi:MAG: insulinase family protein [Clostridia bacterium]|nr:insulinase family protein [Clostridia bacterium]
MNKSIYVFPDGLRLIHCAVSGVRSVAIGILTGVGSGNESNGNNGISHCIEHMMFKGTSRRSALEISEEFDNIGAQSNAYTSKQTTCYYAVALSEHVGICADVLSDMLFNSAFDEEELDKERKVIDEEISISEDDGADLCIDILSQVYFGDNALGMPILGPRKNVAAFKGDDLRRYIADNYSATDTVVCLTGNISFEDARALTEKYFVGRLPRLKRNWQDVPHESRGGFMSVDKDLEQAHLAIGFPSIPYSHSKDMALTAFNAVLGGSMSSRLFQEVRERNGLAYTVFSSPSTYINNGCMCIYAGVNPSMSVSAADKIAKVIKDIKIGGITAEELTRGKQQIKSAYVMSQESTSGMMRQLSKYALFTGNLLDIDAEIARIDAITLDDIRYVCDMMFDFDKVSVTYVGKKCKGDIYSAVRNA